MAARARCCSLFCCIIAGCFDVDFGGCFDGSFDGCFDGSFDGSFVIEISFLLFLLLPFIFLSEAWPLRFPPTLEPAPLALADCLAAMVVFGMVVVVELLLLLFAVVLDPRPLLVERGEEEVKNLAGP